MTELPNLLRRVPFILYALAVAFFVASWLLTLTEINTVMAYAEADNPAVRIAKMRGLYQASLDAVYLAGYGATTHILIWIWGATRARRSGDEK